MRVVAGSARGRRLVTPQDLTVRPTTDRVREATFNVLGSMEALGDARVVDLFAGTGALGIEALSRGARHVVFVDADRAARTLVSENLTATGFDDPDRASIVANDAFGFLEQHHGSFDVALVDPPYRFACWHELWALLDPRLASDGVVVVESDRSIEPPRPWMTTRCKRYGGTVVSINVREGPSPHPPEPQP